MAKKSAKKAEDTKVIEVKKAPAKKSVVKCVSVFYDVKAGITRHPGDQWEVDAERLAQIEAAQKAQGATLVEVL